MESGERNFSEVGSFVCHWIYERFVCFTYFFYFYDNSLGDEISAWDGIGYR